MSASNGYEIRLELLKMAKEMLEQDWHSDRDSKMVRYHSQVEMANRQAEKSGADIALPDFPEFKPFPSETEIIVKAKTLNEFINQKS